MKEAVGSGTDKVNRREIRVYMISDVLSVIFINVRNTGSARGAKIM